MRTYDRKKKDSSPVPTDQTKALRTTQSLGIQPPTIQAQSNAEGLAEWKIQQQKWARLGTPWMNKVPNPSGELVQPWIQRQSTLFRPGEYQLKNNGEQDFIIPELSDGDGVIRGKFIENADRPKEIEKLQDTYPNIKEGTYLRSDLDNPEKSEIVSKSRVTEKGEAFWNKYLGPTTFSGIIGPILDSNLTKIESETPISVDIIEESDNSDIGISLRLKIDVNFESKDRKFSINKVFREVNSQLEAYIETIEAYGGDKGGREVFSEALIPLFKDNKVKTVKLKASAIGGRQDGIFVWARYGFIPIQKDWDTKRKKGYQLLLEDYQDEDWVEEAKSILCDSSPRAIRNLILISWVKKGNATKFLNAFLTLGGSWDGELDLENPKDLAWIERYAGRDKKSFNDLKEEINVGEIPKEIDDSLAEEGCKFKCYITTACVRARDLDDDCEELMVLRSFRDSFILMKRNGKELVDYYYRYSPLIVRRIDESEDSELIYRELYVIIRKCVQAIQSGENEYAFQKYCEMVVHLKEQFLPKLSIPSLGLFHSKMSDDMLVAHFS
ncbi:CFI-box-CTERM domain-containing protein [Acaryochloris sp. IP29b_bin.137]|uniref:CFI-box-CTERM domain-containing protein n=1 Tax=Acaryochloris sp. IP29b_bin.137 TaxID=2969217 RepID=UPI00261017BE|nr:CFI-box-CTERM domain-containing protein [Acaryochloris sp. IP29b_bin.137]